ncbi:hypothetical protein BCR35DRAFT_325608 [Leucosporidium creatinivorum]|uniref:GDP-Man:Man(3)GlcNAc(2)-PP-Dol alpha-1,2-mannosyltransferase n=1 Tax=Leucosporidium creatinivorum TaxID=106004 RepID=A0A1Y2EZ40_9BASI|nr:hypothetical protein BCR35DRAFT_325608 [Leucosporidium creatinivorum]
MADPLDASTSARPSSATENNVRSRKGKAGKTKEEHEERKGHHPWYSVAFELENKGSVARDHLAAERTYLAWLRTSLALASIGIAITQLFRLPSSTTKSPSSTSSSNVVVSATATSLSALTSQLASTNSTAASSELATIRALVLEQAQQISVLQEQVNDPQKYRHLGKPVGGTFIALALLFLVLGSVRYFTCQSALMQEPSKFPPSRRSVAFASFCVAAIVIATFAAILATSNAGGGGERVLWAAVACLQREEPELICVVYTGDVVQATKEEMIAKVQNRFGIALNSDTLAFVPLRSRYLVEDSAWPRFTLLGQSLGSMYLALQGLREGFIPDVWIDTMGYAFAYPVIKTLCRVPVGSYTHYPTISTDMLRRVHYRQAGHTNTSAVAKSAILTYLKLFYYIIFAELYSLSLRQADVLMVNSTWTKRHVNHLLKPFGWRDDVDPEEEVDVEKDSSEPGLGDGVEKLQDDGLRRRRAFLDKIGSVGSDDVEEKKETVPRTSAPKARFRRARTVYPPCDTVALAALPLEPRENIILTVAQFRPEKEHNVQLEALRLLFDAEPKYRDGEQRIRLILAGSVRNEGDEERVRRLRELAKESKIEDNVEFAVNVPFPELIALFGKASIGLHTMIDEHFGITVVEFMAAGLIPLAHSSAGPLLDIVVPYNDLPTGLHATSPETFASQLANILALEPEAKLAMQERARKNATERFSEAVFEESWMKSWLELRALSEGDEEQ